MAKAKYFAPTAGRTTGKKSGKRFTYPAGVFEAEAGDLDHVGGIEKYNPSKNGKHYEAGVKAGWIKPDEAVADEETSDD